MQVKKIQLLILVQLLCLSSFGQIGTIDSVTKSITIQLVNRGYFTLWEGLPWEYQNGMEIPIYPDLDRRILFSKDSSFQEIVFKDDNENTWTDTCFNTKLKVYVTVLYSGIWAIKDDTIQLTYVSKKEYPEAEFNNCFYLSRYKKFECNTAALCIASCSYNRLFLLQNEQLQELGNLEYRYK